jgi:hypothetical protein
MAFKFSAYTADFREKAVADGFIYVTSQILSVIPATIGHLIDVLLGLDGILGNDRYNYLHGPFGVLFGTLFFGLGYLLGAILQIIVKAPAFIGSMIDLAVTKLQERFFNIGGPNAFDVMIVNTLPGMALSMFLFALPTNLALPERMKGPVGFALGLIPALVQHFINRLAAVANAIIKYPVDHFSDAVNYVYSGILSGLKSVFSKKKTDSETPSQLQEDEPLVPAEPKKKKRITRKKDADAEVIKESDELKKVLENNTDLLGALSIDPNTYLNATRDEQKGLIKAAYRQQARLYHPDKHAPESKEDLTELAKKWEDVLAANNILSDDAKSKVYTSTFYRDNNRNGFFHQPAKQTPAEPTAAAELNLSQPANDADKPRRRIKITRKGR